MPNSTSGSDTWDTSSHRAGLWSEFEAFLLEEDTPLLPYWRGLSLFPPGYDTAALDERLWNHPDRHRFFEALQRSGERSLLAEVLERFVASRGIASLDIYALNLFVDIVHLGGDYQRAVALCDSYLDARPRQAVLKDTAAFFASPPGDFTTACSSPRFSL